jgi:4a-hydroxytetrahydrobiopterin dehydratase
MIETITPRQFHEAAGIEDWRVLTNVAHAHFRTGSFSESVALVDAIGRLADAANHHPDVDLRPEGVTVRLTTTTHDHHFWLGEHDLELARQISAAAHELGVPADPTAVQTIQVTIHALVHPQVMPFWRAVLGYREVGSEDLLDPHSYGPPFWFQQMDEPRRQRNRIHIDIWVPHDQAEARVAAAIAAGGHLVTDQHAPAWWTLADAEGNEADVATWMGRD